MGRQVDQTLILNIGEKLWPVEFSFILFLKVHLILKFVRNLSTKPHIKWEMSEFLSSSCLPKEDLWKNFLHLTSDQFSEHLIYAVCHPLTFRESV